MPTLKINKWDSEKLNYLCDKEDKLDLCLYINGEQIKIEGKTEETEDWIEHEFDLDEEITKALDTGKFKWAIRLNGKTVEPITIIISNPEDDEKDNED